MGRREGGREDCGGGSAWDWERKEERVERNMPSHISPSTHTHDTHALFLHLLGASTAFVALSALASFSFVWRGAVRRRGEEAERRLGQLAALEDDPYVACSFIY